jgi:hypothetical protein
MEPAKTLSALFGVGLSFIATTAYALPFSVVANGSLPGFIIPGASTSASASYIITNTSRFNPPSNKVKWLPPNVTINPNGTTCTPTSGFHLSPGQSCTLNLTITGDINRNDPNNNHHLMICMSDNATCAGPAPANSLNVTTVASWINNLSANGYKPVQGNAFLLTNSACPLFVSIFNSCFGQNTAAPYIVPQPPIEQSYVDPYYATQLETPGPNGPTDIFYRLGNNDALVTVVSYPPTAAYLGYQSYMFSREISNYVGINPPRARTVSPDANRYEVVGSVGNDINNVITQNQGGIPWGGKIVMYITTSNQTLANALVSNAVANGIDRNSILIEPVGSNVITGNDSAADDMITLIRYAIPQNTSAGTSWINAFNQNVLVYKVTNTNINVDRFGANQYTAHLVNHSELSLSTAQQQLVALLQTYLTSAQLIPSDNKQTAVTTVDNASGIPVSGLVGSYCIATGTNCEADNQDTSTYTNLVLRTLGPLETAFIVGINHSVLDLNNNRYVSVDIYNAINSSGVASTSQTNPDAVGFNSGILTGSAQAVLLDLGIVIPTNDTELLAHLSDLYVTFMARDCHNPTIAAASDYCINLMGNTLVPLGYPMSIT